MKRIAPVRRGVLALVLGLVAALGVCTAVVANSAGVSVAVPKAASDDDCMGTPSPVPSVTMTLPDVGAVNGVGLLADPPPGKPGVRFNTAAGIFTVKVEGTRLKVELYLQRCPPRLVECDTAPVNNVITIVKDIAATGATEISIKCQLEITVRVPFILPFNYKMPINTKILYDPRTDPSTTFEIT